MAVEVPPGVLDGVETGADVQRHVHTALSGNRSGVCGATDLAVSQSSTPGMTVAVAAGYALVAGSTVTHQGMYGFHNDATVDVAISPGDPANPRNDIVCAQIRDASYAGVDSDARFFVVEGTPAAVPSDPALPASALSLARVVVAANESTSILNADITDLRVFAGDYFTLSRSSRQQLLSPSVSADTPTVLGTWVTLGSLTVPAWATSLVAEVSVSGVFAVTGDTQVGLSLQLGGVSPTTGKAARMFCELTGSPRRAGPTLKGLWNGLTPGASLSLIVRAERLTGTGAIRCDAASGFETTLHWAA